MSISNDRNTWVSTVPTRVPRLSLRSDRSVRTVLDGAWWPRSRTTLSEVTDLVTGLATRDITVNRIMLNVAAWDAHPRRVGIAGHTVRLGWFATLDRCLLIATTGDGQRVDLLVLDPQTGTDRAREAMSMATGGSPALTPAAILAAVDADAARQIPTTTAGGQTLAEDVWESEGGHRDRAQLAPPTAAPPARAPVTVAGP